MSTILFQGRQVSIDNPPSSMSMDVISLIEDHMKISSVDREEPNNNNNHSETCTQLSLFSSNECPFVSLDHYIERRLEHLVVIFLEDKCWQSFKQLISDHRSSGQKRKEVFALSWSLKQKDKGILCHSDESCRSLVKVSDLLNKNNVSENVGNVRHFLESEHEQDSSQDFCIVELDDVANPGTQFERLRKLGKNFDAHWFQAFVSGFIWTKSSGQHIPSKNLRPVFQPFELEEQKWLQYLEKEEWKNIILIYGVAGIGKSVFLSKIAEDLKSQNNHKLVLFVNLKQFDEVLIKSGEVKTEKDLNILTFLHLLTLYFRIENKLEESILKCMMSSNDDDDGNDGKGTGPQVELLMDDLHLMSKQGRKFLLEFFRRERKLSDNWSYRIWLTTRPHLRHMVEDKLCVIGYSIDTFSRPDIEQFLACRRIMPEKWRKSIMSPSLQFHIKLDLMGLLSVPHRLKGFERSVSILNIDPFLFKASDVMKILLDDVQWSYGKTYLSDLEKDLADAKIESVTRKTVAIALRSLMPHKFEEVSSHLSEQELLEFGLVTKNDAGRIIFVHEAYAAFLVADYMFHTMASQSPTLQDFFLKEFLLKDECEDVRMFYEQLMTSGMNSEIRLSWSEILRAYFIRSYNLDKESIDHNRVHTSGNILQLAIIDKRLLIAKFILRSFLPNHLKELRRLISRKTSFEINSVVSHCPKCFEELSSLSLAIMFGDVELVSIMFQVLELDEKKDEHLKTFLAKDSLRFTPIHLAVIGCNVKIMDYLLRHQRYSANFMDSLGHTPLHMVFYNKWTLKFAVSLPFDEIVKVEREVEICKYVHDKISKRKSINLVADRSGQFPMLLSQLRQSYYEEELQKGKDVFHKELGNPRKIWWYKPASFYESLAEKLIGRTFLNFSRVADGIEGKIEPPFHLACQAGHLSIMKMMLDKHVNINIKDKDGYSALMTAIFNGQIEVVDFLRQNGIDEDDLKKDYDDIPLWHHICSLKLPNMMKYLYATYNWDVNLKLKDGRTPLHIATAAGSVRTSKLLIRFGAEVDNRDKEGLTPLLRTCRQPPEKCSLAIVELLIENSADINAQDKANGYGPLHQAVLQGNVPLVKLLLQNEELNVNLSGKGGQTPLHLACKTEGNLKMIKCLIRVGNAGIEVEDEMEQTPLMILARSGNKDRDMAIYLMEQGSMIHHQSSLGRTPMMELETKNKEVYNTLKAMFWSML